MMETNCVQTPVDDLVQTAIGRMQAGARMILDAIPNDSSLSSASFGPNVTAEIARRLTPSPPAQEESALAALRGLDTFLDFSEPLQGGCLIIEPSTELDEAFASASAALAVPPQEGGIAEVEAANLKLMQQRDLAETKRADTERMYEAEFSRLSAIVKAQKEALEALAPVEDMDFIADDQAIVLHFVKDGISYNFPAFTWGDLRRARALSDTVGG